MVHSLTFTAGPAHIDVLGHVNNAVWLQWMEALATSHWEALAPAEWREAYVWVVTRHEIDYRGNIALGAPNLRDNIWLYGGSIKTIRETVAKGRNNQMPAHADKLGATRIKLLTAYVLNLSGAADEEPEEHEAQESPEGSAHEPTDTAGTAAH